MTPTRRWSGTSYFRIWSRRSYPARERFDVEADLVSRSASVIPVSSSASATQHQSQHFRALQPIYFTLPLRGPVSNDGYIEVCALPHGRYFLDTIAPNPSCILAKVVPALRGERLLVWAVARGLAIHMYYRTGRRDGNGHVSTPRTLLLRFLRPGCRRIADILANPARARCTHTIKPHRWAQPQGRSAAIGPLPLASYSYPRRRDLRLLRRFVSHVGEFPAAGGCSPGARDSIARPRAKSRPESVSRTRLLIAAPVRGEHYPDLGCGLFAIVDCLSWWTGA